MHDFDQQSGVILFSQIGKNGLSCWNTEMPLNPTNAPLVAQDHEHLVYPADLNVSLRYLYFLSKTFHVY